MYKYSSKILKKNRDHNLREVTLQRKIDWRKQDAIVRVNKPLRLKRARSLGYKANQGFLIVRVRVRRGGLRKTIPKGGRRQKRMGVKKFVPAKSMQLIAEERAKRVYPNLEVLNSYWVGEDGRYKWFEVIFVDPNHPTIRRNEDMNWICRKSQSGRVYRGLTSAGKKIRG